LGMLEGKTAVVYGAAGVIGSATAKAFAREGAFVLLAGRTQKSLEPVEAQIRESGGLAQSGVVDALDERSVEDSLSKLVGDRKRVDVSYNLMATGVAMGARLAELSEKRFSSAAFDRVRSNFITATAAARIMQKQGSGVVIGLTASTGRLPQAQTGGFSVGCAAIETLLKQLAVEVGPSGVRVVCLRSGATPESPVLQEVYQRLAEVRGTTKEIVERAEAEHTALKRSPRIAEVANAAVLVASDYAGAITATPVNASCGELVD
jgi:3-oxoacyl-[acyl-carrier protein] reductase